ncbi:MAG: type II secretion system minor pseudopilin GspK [Hyphomonadaceae bacterium]
MTRWAKDKGAALVTVLVMVSIMAALAIVATHAARASVQRASNQRQMDQARWYLMGAETYAAAQIARLARVEGRAPNDASEWEGRALTYPLDDGLMQATLRDGDNCFNLNSIVEGTEAGALVASARGQVHFARLLDLTGVRGDLSLAAALADWIDSDSETGAGGAEDDAYEGRWRTPNSLIGDVSELAHVRGFTAEAIAALRPYVCVRPTAEPNRLNVNTLRPERGALLSVLMGDALSANAARDLLRTRPPGGWESVEAFLAQPQLLGAEQGDLAQQLSVQTRYYVLAARVSRGDLTETSLALIESGQRARVVRRIFGAGASEHLM